jgi:hypothetical protein
LPNDQFKPIADFKLSDQTFVQKFENCLPSNGQSILSTEKNSISQEKNPCSDIQRFLISFTNQQLFNGRVNVPKRLT